MRKAISIYGDKEYITHVGADYVRFRFPDGSGDTLKTKKEELRQTYEWYDAEVKYCYRAHQEILEIYHKNVEQFNKSHRYYSEEEIKAACKTNRFADIDMKMSNAHYLKDWDQIYGMHLVASEFLRKYEKHVAILYQISKVLNAM